MSIAQILPRRIKNLTYFGLVGLLKIYSRFFWDFRCYGLQRIPAGPKIFVSNHVTSTDPYWLMMVVPELLHIVIGPPYQIRGIAPLFDAFEQINALPENRRFVVEQSAHYLTRGESVCICPEGDVQEPFQLGHFYTGMAQIYRRSGAAIVPIALAVERQRIRRHPKWDIHMDERTYESRMMWRGKVRLMVGDPIRPAIDANADHDQENERITAQIKEQIRLMLQQLQPEFDLPSVEE